MPISMQLLATAAHLAPAQPAAPVDPAQARAPMDTQTANAAAEAFSLLVHSSDPTAFV